MILHLIFLNLIFAIIVVYGQNNVLTNECEPVNKLLGKDPSFDCCSYNGITCTDGHVIKIELNSKGLNGAIPSELGDLTKLEILNLNENNLTGSIPSQLGNLSNLNNLELSNNNLSGQIPSELGKLSNLTSLRLGTNNLSGHIPVELVLLSKLKT
eukprot:jgi/Orpsp1_1/1177932/evm.model.c7180000063399.1